MIEFKNIVHRYKNKTILNDFSLEIQDKSVTSILGQSGSGKTTLLRLLCGLEEVQSGSIKINVDMTDSPIKSSTNGANISFIFQDLI